MEWRAHCLRVIVLSHLFSMLRMEDGSGAVRLLPRAHARRTELLGGLTVAIGTGPSGERVSNHNHARHQPDETMPPKDTLRQGQ